jgi:hypothetical protein
LLGMSTMPCQCLDIINLFAVSIQSYALSPIILARSDLLCTLPRRFLERFTATLDLLETPSTLALAAWTAKAHLQVQFAYGLNDLIGMDNAIIVDVEATPARVYEVRATRTMLARTKRHLGIKPKHLAGDTADGTGSLLGWLVGQHIAPHIPVWDKSQREDGTFPRKARSWRPPAGCMAAPRCSTAPANMTARLAR